MALCSSIALVTLHIRFGQCSRVRKAEFLRKRIPGADTIDLARYLSKWTGDPATGARASSAAATLNSASAPKHFSPIT